MNRIQTLYPKNLIFNGVNLRLLNCRLDEGTNPPQVAAVIRQFEDHAAAWKLLGAGGGGYLLILGKDPEAAARIRAILEQNPPNARARLVGMTLSSHGFQLTRS